ncbi:hypothetical protein [Planobispora rosea]|nr:hypothetical protein [Planobispora rosea]
MTTPIEADLTEMLAGLLKGTTNELDGIRQQLDWAEPAWPDL